MEEYQLTKARDCIYNIQDKLFALRDEINRGTPYANYCLEKLEPMRIDVNCLISIFKEEKNE